LAGLAVGILGWATAYFLRVVLDHLSESTFLLAIAAGIGGAVVLRAALAVVRRAIQLGLVQRIEGDLAGRYMRHVFRLEAAQYEAYPGGDLFYRIEGIDHIRHALEDRIIGVTFDSILVAVAAALLLRYGILLSALAVLSALIPAVIVRFIRSMIGRSFEVTEKAGSRFASECMDALRGTTDLKLHQSEAWMVGRISERYRERQQSRIRHLLRLSTIGNSTSVLSSLLGIVILLAGAREVLHTRMTSGDLVFVFTMSGTMLGPLENLVVSWLSFDDALCALRRCEEVLCAPSEPVGSECTQASLEGTLRLDHVTFEYGLGKTALEDVTIEIPRGATLAIVGESGAGKSTLLLLLARLRRPTTGHILLDGRDVGDIPLDSWRSQLGVVCQNAHLFEASVEANLRLGHEGASRTDLEKALEEACLIEWVRDLPEGLSTVLREGGRSLSAGQGQRLVLARALLRRPKLLLLDEAMSNLDIASETAIWSALEKRTGDRTTIFVTHRLASSMRADRILVLEAGKVAESGTYEELMAARGKYFALWERQSARSRETEERRSREATAGRLHS
jgi:ATP-binding cassette subfamily B protein